MHAVIDSSLWGCSVRKELLPMTLPLRKQQTSVANLTCKLDLAINSTFILYVATSPSRTYLDPKSDSVLFWIV